MRFTYQEFEITLSPGIFRKKLIYRPIIPVVLMYGKRLLGYQSVVDSGSDYCVFESKVAELLGIKVSKGNKRKIRGIGGTDIKGYEHKIVFKVAGKVYDTLAVFSTEIPENSFGVLGNKGFFDHFRVNFDYRKKYFDAR